jgi:CheY-like chemotaxis protein
MHITETPREDYRGRRILVVEDNDDTAETLALLLRIHGHEVRVAHDGPAALAEVADWLPRVVFLDLNLPGGMDGFEAARQLRSRNGRAVRLVALTGCGHDTDRQRAEEAGFDDYLVKPAGLEELVRAMS